ncbi:MAG: hypothetical protein QG654_457 [Patescibacteria group bacterium]|nr:hypothetical protein [Patescibacteria group bacterium]
MPKDGVMPVITVVDPSHPVDYSKVEVPPSYTCRNCGATNCKLWRDFQDPLEYQTLLCAKCAAREQGKDIASIDANGMRDSTVSGRTDQIGWRIPAVPTESNNTFWEYNQCPQAGCEWWKKLPTHPAS